MPASWEDLVRDHASRVYRLAYGLTRNPHDAEDLTQNVFDRVFRNLASYKPGNFDGWLYRITVNLFRDQLRRNRRLRLEPLREDAVNLHAARQPSPEQAASEPVFDDDVREALAALHPDIRSTVLLCDVDGLTYDEIAAVLGVPRGTVGSRLHRGRAQLRTALVHRSPRTRQTAAATRDARCIPSDPDDLLMVTDQGLDEMSGRAKLADPLLNQRQRIPDVEEMFG